MSHDQNFKNLILDYPHQALTFFATAEADAIGVAQDNERVEYQHDYPDEAKTMSRLAERFREEGMQQGEALVLERQLRLKFGTLPMRYGDGSNRPTNGLCWSGSSGSLPPIASTRFYTESGAKPKWVTGMDAATTSAYPSDPKQARGSGKFLNG